MSLTAATRKSRGIALILGWRRVRFTLGVSLLFGVFLGLLSETAMIIVIWRALLVGMTVLLAYWITTGGDPQFATDEKRVMGYWLHTFTGVLFAPWIAVGVMFKQRDAFARDQALAFELERSRLSTDNRESRWNVKP